MNKMNKTSTMRVYLCKLTKGKDDQCEISLLNVLRNIIGVVSNGHNYKKAEHFGVFRHGHDGNNFMKKEGVKNWIDSIEKYGWKKCCCEKTGFEGVVILDSNDVPSNNKHKEAVQFLSDIKKNVKKALDMLIDMGADIHGFYKEGGHLILLEKIHYLISLMCVTNHDLEEGI